MNQFAERVWVGRRRGAPSGRRDVLRFRCRRLHILVTFAVVAVAGGCLAVRAEPGRDDVISLAGEWRFRLDPDDRGERDAWFTAQLGERVRLPGDLAAQGLGDPPGVATRWTGSIRNPQWAAEPALQRYAQPGNFKFPYWLTPERHFVGAAWYQRTLDIPAQWSGRRIALFLERPHWETRVWVDGAYVGSGTALGTPHEFALGTLAAGAHVLTIRVDNRLVVDVGTDSHSVSDHTQGNWNGIVGRIELHATPLVWLEDIQAYPDANDGIVRVRGRVGNATGRRTTATLRLALAPPPGGSAGGGATSVAVECPSEGGPWEAEVRCTGTVGRWDEFSPHLYRLTAELEADGMRDTRAVTLGFRDVSVQGTQFVVNGRKAFFRGTLECAIFPLTGHPPTDVESWRKVIRAAKAHGLNLLRFHSWCPPEAAFAAADELGLYLHVEASSWANHSTTLGDGKPVDAWLYGEAERMLRYHGNHPSFVLMMYGNEPGGRNHRAYLSQWVQHFRRADPRRLYAGGAGWPQLAEDQFHVAPEPRVQRWGEGLKSRINARPPETTTDYREYVSARRAPVISHEIGQWCVYPDFREIEKYTGYLKPGNFEIFRDRLAARGLADQAEAFLFASGRLQTLCYKEDIEAALRTPGMGGFELLDLHDFPGQGTALVGVLNPFWESKGYVEAEEYRQFCNSTVLLARLPSRVFTAGETLEAAVEVAHFGAAPLQHAVAEWRVMADSGRPVAGGEFPARPIPVDNGTPLGRVTVALSTFTAPARYRLETQLRGTQFKNGWDFWLYPESEYDGGAAGADVVVAHDLDDGVATRLSEGGKVLLLIAPSRVVNASDAPVALGFSSIFWNTAWTNRQPPTTLGILCDPRHPALRRFPTDDHSNWQWWYVIRRAGAMIMDDAPRGLRPIVQVIDDWVTARRLALVFEARVGAGKLVVCSADLENDLAADPVRRQLRASLLAYMAGAEFQPRTAMSVDQVRRLMVAK